MLLRSESSHDLRFVWSLVCSQQTPEVPPLSEVSMYATRTADYGGRFFVATSLTAIACVHTFVDAHATRSQLLPRDASF